MPDRPAACPPPAKRAGPGRRRAGRATARAMLAAWLTAAFASALAPTPVAAQYQWRDENGRMVFSDQPPPPGVPRENVLRAPVSAPLTVPATRPAASGSATGAAPAPAGQPPVAAAAAAPAAGAAAGTAAGAPTPGAGAGAGWQDKAMEFRKRQADKADAERKSREEADKAQRTAASCENLRTQVRTLESGVRVTEVDRSGERTFLSDEDRARRLETLRRDARDSCGGKG